MSYCLYLRKSRIDAEVEEHGEGETLVRHEKTLIELAKRLHLNVTEIYREVVSGESIASRPVMQQLLTSVELGLWEGVLVMEVERLARGDTVDQGIMAQTFKFSNTKIITPLKTYDPNNEFDEEYFEFGLFMSRREYKTINRRLQNGRLASVKEGKYTANRPPYGYRRVKLEKEKGWTLEPVPEEAEIIRLIFEWYTIGLQQSDGSRKRIGISLIVRRLNNLNIPAAKGKDWVPASVRDMLRNPVYAGFIRWNCRHSVKKMVDGKITKERPRSPAEECIIVPGLHPAIISEETYNLVKELMAKNPPRPISERNTVKNPLSGLIICGGCGRRMVRRPYNNLKTPDTLMCPATSCHNVSSALHYVERHVLAALAEWVAEYRLKWKTDVPQNLSEINFKRKSIKRLTEELKNLDKQFENIHDLLEQKIYTTEKFLERSRLLSERIQASEANLATFKEEIALEEIREESRRNIIPKVEHLLEIYDSLTDAKSKNDLLKEVLEKVVYTKEKTTRWTGSPDDFHLVLYPKLPSPND